MSETLQKRPKKPAEKTDFERLKDAANQPPDPIAPYFDVMYGGLCYVGVHVDKETGTRSYESPIRLCDEIEIKGRGINDSGEHSRILHWHSRGDRKDIEYNLPARIIGERESWGQLRARGLAISPKKRHQELLADYLQTNGSEVVYRVTSEGGWRDGAYLLPSGEMIGKPQKPLFFERCSDENLEDAYSAKGTLQDWQNSVARLARHNSRPTLGIGCAFAAPLLKLAGIESGGVHLYATSGSGKSTSAQCAGSVWGHAEEQKLNWDATAYALSTAAHIRNDGLMILDEIGQGNAKDIALSAYRLFNGMGKMQGARDGGNRLQRRWKVLVMSTGEEPLNIFMKGGGQNVKAGQEVRLASIPADTGKGFGVFDCLHEFPDSGRLAEALGEATKNHYGTAGRAFIEYVASRQEEITERLKREITLFRDDLTAEASGQVRRVAARFAVISEALEIATDAGITGWQKGDGKNQILQCLHDWVAHFGVKPREEQQVINQVEGWFALHAWSRFIDVFAANSDKEVEIRNCAGYRKRDGKNVYWLVFPSTFNDELSAGFDPKYTAKVLAEQGMLEVGNDGKSTTKHRTPDYQQSNRRFYKFVSIGQEAEDE